MLPGLHRSKIPTPQSQFHTKRFVKAPANEKVEKDSPLFYAVSVLNIINYCFIFFTRPQTKDSIFTVQWKFRVLPVFTWMNCKVGYNSREFFTKSTSICTYPNGRSLCKKTMRVITKDVVRLWIKVSGFHKRHGIIILHILKNCLSPCEVPQQIPSSSFRGFPVDEKNPW